MVIDRKNHIALLTMKPRLNNSRFQNYLKICFKGNEKEEYTTTAVRESRRRLKGCFGEELWKVALEPEY